MTAKGSKPDFEDCFGEWWRVDHPDDRLPGTLRRDRGSGTWVLTLLRDGAGSEVMRHGVIEDGDTFFGRTTAGDVTVLGANLGEQHERSSPGPGFEGRRTAEVWTAFAAILDGHFKEGTRWQAIGAKIPHAWHWYSPTVLAGGPKRDLTSHDYEELTCVYRDVEIALWCGTDTSTSGTEKRYTGTAGYSFKHPGGITVADVEQIVLAINNLHRVLFGRAMSTDVLTLRGVDVDSDRTATYVHGAPAQVPDIGTGDPFIGTDDINFSDFLPRWIALHIESPTWPTLGPPGDDGGWLHTNSLEAVAALESIAREHLLETAAIRPMHDAIFDAAEKGGIRSKPKRYLRHLLDLDGPSLSDRLCALADSLGKGSADWLLGPSTRDWATTVARVRNSLAHGVKAAGELELGPEVLIAVMETSRVLFRLTLVRLAGYPHMNGGHLGELLVDAHGRLELPHKNSALVDEMHNARQFRRKWQRWAEQLEATGPTGESADPPS